MPKRMTYEKAGVSISQGNLFVNKIKPHVTATKRTGTMGSIGGFGGFFRMPKNIKNPLLVGATDGVGTKLLIAEHQKRYDTIGIDLVAMCVNDLVVCGAEPLFFLDYYATGKLLVKKSVALVKGISKGCIQSGCALIGGETAEMPGLYKKNDFDLAGFSVGVIDEKKVIDGKKVKNGDILIGLASSGLHSNGYSLARKVFTQKEMTGPWGAKLLTPTKIYVKPMLALIKKGLIKSAAHITGGGFYENIPRSLPKNKDAQVTKGSWTIPALFKEIQTRGNISEQEMYRTFNCGIGMVLVVDKKKSAEVLRILQKQKCRARIIGEITSGNGRVHIS